MNDRLNLEALARARANSPSCLFEALGLKGRLFLLRPGKPEEKSGLRDLSRLDDDIGNNGKAWILREFKGERWGIMQLHDSQSNLLKCLSVQYDYTSGQYSLGMEKQQGREVFCVEVREVWQGGWRLARDIRPHILIP